MEVFMLGKRTVVSVNEVIGAKVAGNILTVHMSTGVQFSETYKDGESAMWELKSLIIAMERCKE
jgi:hypothetical protein